MKAVAYSIKNCEKELLIKANQKKHDITLISNRLTTDTAAYADGKDAVLVFPGDSLPASILKELKRRGVKFIATRSTGTDHIDLSEATRLGLKIANVPSYSPESVAEHAITLILALSRNILVSQNQMHDHDFSLNNLVGNTIKGKTVGIVGFGGTGKALGKILSGFGARVLINDVVEKADCTSLGAIQVPLTELYEKSDIISYHIPLNEDTHHLVDSEAIKKMKDGVMLINVSRGAVFNTQDIYEALLRGKISKIGMDVYEFEQNVFFFNHRKKPIQDSLLQSLIQNQRILLTPHQAFLTEEALKIIAEKTITSMDLWEAGKCAGNACCCGDACVENNLAIA